MNYQKETKQAEKFSVGLDIGIASVGWAIIGWNEENNEHWLEDFGVRLFTLSRQTGKTESLAMERRGHRGQRRLLNRGSCRREDLKRYFFSKIWSGKFKENWELFDNFKKKTTNIIEIGQEKIDRNKFFNPYYERHLALQEKIGKVELLKILLHINKYRGYPESHLTEEKKVLEEETNNNDRKKGKEKELGEVEKKINKAKELLKNYDTVAHLLVENERFHRFFSEETKKVKIKFLDLRNHGNKKEEEYLLFPQAELQKEVKKILDKQSQYGEEHWLLKENKEEIIKMIFRKRDFADGPGSRSEEKRERWKNCPFTKEEIKELLKKRDKLSTEEKEKFIQWKDWKKKRNIVHNPYWKNLGSCSKFFCEPRGYKCSFVFSCWQFITEFSKLRFVRKRQEEETKKKDLKKNKQIKFGEYLEKYLKEREIQEVHKKVIEWLIFDYNPQANPNLKKALENHLKEKVEELKELEPIFKEGINFKADFLSWLKKNDLLQLGNFVKRVDDKKNGKKVQTFWENYKTRRCSINDCPCKKIDFQQKINNFEENDLLDKIGELLYKKKDKIICEEIGKVRNSKKEKLQPEEYKGERGPTLVSFRWMVLSIQGFLRGYRYGVFAEKGRREDEEDWKKKFANILNSPLTNQAEKEIFFPWMEKYLVKNSVVFRSFNEARKILQKLDQKGYRFETINIENAKDLYNPKITRKTIQKEQKANKKEIEEAREELTKEKILDNPENIKRYRLWKIYGEICLYCRDKIELKDLGDENKLQLEHIINRGLYSNRLENFLLVHTGENNKKGQSTDFKTARQYIRSKGEGWENWYMGRVSELYQKWSKNENDKNKELRREILELGDDWEYWVSQKQEGDINDTRQIAQYCKKFVRSELERKGIKLETGIKELEKKLCQTPNSPTCQNDQIEINRLKKELIQLKESGVETIKGSITASLRSFLFSEKSPWYYKKQIRSLTPYHHAVDAIVLASFTNFVPLDSSKIKVELKIKFLEDLAIISRQLSNLNRWKRKLKEMDEKEQEINREFVQRQLKSSQQDLAWILVNLKGKYQSQKFRNLYGLADENDVKEILDLLEEASKLENDPKKIRKLCEEKWGIIPDLENVLKNLIPVEFATILSDDEDYKWKKSNNEEVKRVIIELNKVLTEKEYEERLNNLGEKRGRWKKRHSYPYISQMLNYQKGGLFSSQNPNESSGSGDKPLLRLIKYISKKEQEYKDYNLTKIFEKNYQEQLQELTQELKNLGKGEKAEKKKLRKKFLKKVSLSYLIKSFGGDKEGLVKLNKIGEEINFVICENKETKVDQDEKIKRVKQKRNWVIWDTTGYVGFSFAKKDKKYEYKWTTFQDSKKKLNNIIRSGEIFSLEDKNSGDEFFNRPLFITGQTSNNTTVLGTVHEKNKVPERQIKQGEKKTEIWCQSYYYKYDLKEWENYYDNLDVINKKIREIQKDIEKNKKAKKEDSNLENKEKELQNLQEQKKKLEKEKVKMKVKDSSPTIPTEKVIPYIKPLKINILGYKLK